MKRFNLITILTTILLALLAVSSRGVAADPMKVCVTVPDLGSLVKAVGGDEVDVTSFGKGTEDPHFVEARPSFVKELSHADLLLEMGMELEMGWAPVLQKNARNGAVLTGGPGYLDCSTAITPIDVPTAPIDRSQGDVHPMGNPHYLLDPVNGIKVARLIRDRLTRLRPAAKATFDANYKAFHDKVAAALVGEPLAKAYDVEKLMILADHDKLGVFLQSQNQSDLLGGWMGAMAKLRGVKAVGDHNMWRYFALRFGVDLVGYMEPKPGLAPTTSHTAALVGVMKQQHVQLIISSPYFDTRHARFLAEHTDAKAVTLAHQVGATDAAGDYVSMFDHDITAITAALSKGGVR
ncbi:MAG: hypothetical protein GC159_14170 [Phycisphaera sp.]|nr:hypothetical protein [Phycisphaera sp.]